MILFISIKVFVKRQRRKQGLSVFLFCFSSFGGSSECKYSQYAPVSKSLLSGSQTKFVSAECQRSSETASAESENVRARRDLPYTVVPVQLKQHSFECILLQRAVGSLFRPGLFIQGWFCFCQSFQSGIMSPKLTATFNKTPPTMQPSHVTRGASVTSHSAGAGSRLLWKLPICGG